MKTMSHWYPFLKDDSASVPSVDLDCEPREWPEETVVVAYMLVGKS